MSQSVLTEEDYVRKLPHSSRLRLAEILDISNSWERLASKIPAEPDSVFSNSRNCEPRYTMSHIAHFQRKGSTNGGSSTKALIDDWSTKNCKIKHLIEALYQAELRAAAVFIQKEVLHIEPKRDETQHSDNECCAQVVRNTKTPEEEIDFEVTNDLKDFSFDTLKVITNNFDQRNYKDGGNLIGEGGFGTVFIGTFSSGFKVAVKLLKDSTDDSLNQFKTEVETLAQWKHENLVLLLGYSFSKDSPCCLVYQYMPNGSLEERLACRYGTQPLANSMRVEIVKGTARGLAYLHEGGLVHRDIKSANILLDEEFKPKVGDFATARALPAGMSTQIMKASVVIGTMAYLAPEAVNFLIHPSLDSFSFGVVLLEILTGLPVTDPNREEIDLKIHVQEYCTEGEDDDEAGTIFDLLDTQGGSWSPATVEKLYSLSCRCLEHARRKRPTMAEIVSELENLG